MPDLSVIIVNWNTRELLSACLASVYRSQTRFTFDVWVVDNGSSDGSQEMVRSLYPQVRLIENRQNMGFARANNQAMQMSQAHYFLLFNSDAEIDSLAFERMVGLVEEHPQAGIVGAQLFNPDGSFQASYTDFPSLKSEFLILSGIGRLLKGRWYPSHGPVDTNEPLQADYVEGACLLARREAVEKTGGMDESFFMYAEEVDWCFAMKKAGWQVWFHPAARVIHHGGASSVRRKVEREADLYCGRVHFFRKHYGDAKAEQLKRLILITTVLKTVFNRGMRIATAGRKGRQVVSLDLLSARLKGV